jgi:L,D-peptidoglycan transpeptidase YkuD (ErfK/YbiS/YcfS/YnhG family)
VLYRADRIGPPPTGLPCRAIRQGDGWCDDIKDPLYNRPVALPYKASHETLTRADGLYDLLVVIGHNDDPIVSGAGSAIFLHVAAPGYEPTEGCVALSLDDLRAVVAELLPNDPIEILMEND